MTAFRYSELMTTLEADDLLFDREDIRRLFTANGVAVTEGEISGILKESIGYPLGIAVTARCMAGGKPFSPETAARAYREVFTYFEAAIYRRFDLPVRRFLLELAPFERSSLEMARMVSGDPRAAAARSRRAGGDLPGGLPADDEQGNFTAGLLGHKHAPKHHERGKGLLRVEPPGRAYLSDAAHPGGGCSRKRRRRHCRLRHRREQV